MDVLLVYENGNAVASTSRLLFIRRGLISLIPSESVAVFRKFGATWKQLPNAEKQTEPPRTPMPLTSAVSVCTCCERPCRESYANDERSIGTGRQE